MQTHEWPYNFKHAGQARRDAEAQVLKSFDERTCILREARTHTPLAPNRKDVFPNFAGRFFFCFDGEFLLGKLVAEALKDGFFQLPICFLVDTPHLDGLGCDFSWIFLWFCSWRHARNAGYNGRHGRRGACQEIAREGRSRVWLSDRLVVEQFLRP